MSASWPADVAAVPALFACSCDCAPAGGRIVDTTCIAVNSTVSPAGSWRARLRAIKFRERAWLDDYVGLSNDAHAFATADT